MNASRSTGAVLTVLVTGANGFIGRYVTAALIKRAHRVRAMVRSPEQVPYFSAEPNVSVILADLCHPDDLQKALEDIDVVVHLAGIVWGSPSDMHAVMVDGTRNLILAMHKAKVPHLILASSLSVYDWSKVGETLDESSPLAGDCAGDQGAYSAAKSEQEALARTLSKLHGIRLTVFRPGSVWDAKHFDTADLGWRVRCLQIVVAPRRRLRLVHVEHVSEAFADACMTQLPDAATINLVDSESITAWKLARYLRTQPDKPRVLLPVPYVALLTLARSVSFVSRVLGLQKKLPGIFRPTVVDARFKSVRVDTSQWSEKLAHSSIDRFAHLLYESRHTMGIQSTRPIQ